MRWLIHGLTLAGAKVVDCFCGGGASGIAAVQLGRKFHGIEINEEYRNIVEARVASFGSPAARGPTPPLTPNSVTHGNCLDLIPSLEAGSVNLVLTSPPYAEQRANEYPSVSDEKYPEFTVRWMAAVRPKLAEGGSVLIVLDPHIAHGEVADYMLRTVLTLREHGWKQHRSFIWHKPDALPLGDKRWPRHSYEEVLWFSQTKEPFCNPLACGRPTRRIPVGGYSWAGREGEPEVKEGVARSTDVVAVPLCTNESGLVHPARFPVRLASHLIETCCPPGGLVLDPFAGSGSTLCAAKMLGRGHFGFEIVAEYCEEARRRLTAVDSGNPQKEAS